MPATADPPVPSIPTLPAPSIPTTAAESVASELSEAYAAEPPAWSRARRQRTPAPFPAAQPPPARQAAPPPAGAPPLAGERPAPQPLKLSAGVDVRDIPYPYAPKALAGDVVERTFAFFDRLIEGQCLRPHLGDMQAQAADLREHYRLELATRPAKPASPAA